jgi:hypothetical protein
MGYDLHITRAANWSENEEAPITLDEWLVLVDADPELSLTPANGPYFADWRGPSGLAEPWLDWDAGNIYTKNPDSALLRKMAAIAALLGAHVQGDDGELYRGDEKLESDPPSGSGSARSPKKDSWWRRFTGG